MGKAASGVHQLKGAPGLEEREMKVTMGVNPGQSWPAPRSLIAGALLVTEMTVSSGSGAPNLAPGPDSVIDTAEAERLWLLG